MRVLCKFFIINASILNITIIDFKNFDYPHSELCQIKKNPMEYIFCGAVTFCFVYVFRISGKNRRKAVAKDWFGNGEEVTIVGKLEFIQESPYDVTDVEVNLEGLNGKMSGYHVHMVIK